VVEANLDPDILKVFAQDRPVIELRALDPGYSGHGSDVWLVRTAAEEMIIRSSRLREEPDHEFWWGLKALFGVDPRDLIHFEAGLKLLRGIPDIPVPRVLGRKQLQGREYLAVERMKGSMLSSFVGQPDGLLRQFGVWLAKVHSLAFDGFGNLAGTQAEAKERFHPRLAETMRIMVEREHAHDPAMNEYLAAVLEELRHLPAPESFCPVMIDMGPTQFLAENGKITALVDAEAYAAAPRELDFIGLEYELDERAARPFIEGYSSVFDMPDLSRCRRAYRFFYRLMGVAGSVDIRRWMAQTELF
jgi:aminoglycoside phosphotransferase (APT) family kinase protein